CFAGRNDLPEEREQGSPRHPVGRARNELPGKFVERTLVRPTRSTLFPRGGKFVEWVTASSPDSTLFSPSGGARDRQTGVSCSERQRYRVASVRWGRHGSAICCSSAAVGSSGSP